MRGLARVKLGLIIVGIGETIADAGAKLAKCERLHSTLYYKGYGSYSDAVPIKIK
jgi:hypothetical protein